MSGQTQQHERLPRQGLVLLVALALGWGFNWPVMKAVLAEVPPLCFRGGCLVLGGLGILAIARLSGAVIAIPAERWGRLFLVTLSNIVAWNTLAIYGVLLLPSGRAALLGYTMPLWSVLLSIWLLGERLSAARSVALLLGLAGVGVLMGDSLTDMLAAPRGLAGVLYMLAAAWSWALGVVLLKRLPIGVPTTTLTGWMLLLGGLPMFIVGLFLESDRLVWPSFWPVFGIFYNIGIAFMFCYWAWNRIVLMVPVAVSSLSSLATPLIGVLDGMLFLGERPGWQEVLAAMLILAAVGTVSFGGLWEKAGKTRRPPD